jgi:UDP-N-acetyl-D-mannosaminuronic acid dehydrogenase
MSKIDLLFCKVDTPLMGVMQIINNAARFNLPSGIAIVVDTEGQLLGTITDGDVRRALLGINEKNLLAEQVMNANPIYFPESLSVRDILVELPKQLSYRGRKANRFLGKILIVDNHKRPVRIIEYHELWEQRVASHRHIVIVGLGYVGLTMALIMADAGFMVTGVEADRAKRNLLLEGHSYILEHGLEDLLRKEIGRNFHVQEYLPDDGDVYIISVGTPVQQMDSGQKKPILDYLQEAAKVIGQKLRRGNLVVLRSTVPIGTTRTVVKTILENESGLKCGLDFYLSFAPERTAEGKALKELRSLPQIIGGHNSESVEATAAIFRDITPTIVRVNSFEEAEMSKLINNCFRDYIFAFSNYLAKIAFQFNIDIVDVINASNEGYIRDPVPLPSPGVGGPCLTKDPHIFASVVEKLEINPSLFLQGRDENESMHIHVVNQVVYAIRQVGKEFHNIKIFVMGLAFKGYPETGDIRDSSGVEITKLLQSKFPKIVVYDPVATREDIEMAGFDFVNISEGFRDADTVLFLNNHRSFEKIDMYNLMWCMKDKPVIYDGWKLFRANDITSIRPSIYMNLSIYKDSLS